MSIEAMTWALSSDVGDATRKLVLIGRANHAHKDGTSSYAGKGTLAEYVNCSEKTIRRHTIALEADGWIRVGDQSLVAHIRADRRPIVYDLAMTEATRLAWKAEYEATTERGDNLSGRADVTGGQPDPASDTHGGTHGGSPVSERGDTAMSPEPSLTDEQPPTPAAADCSTTPAFCARHPKLDGKNCRACGTTSRQLAEAADRQAAEQRRTNAQLAAAIERERKHLHAVPLPADLKATTQAAIANSRQQQWRTS